MPACFNTKVGLGYVFLITFLTERLGLSIFDQNLDWNNLSKYNTVLHFITVINPFSRASNSPDKTHLLCVCVCVQAFRAVYMDQMDKVQQNQTRPLAELLNLISLCSGGTILLTETNTLICTLCISASVPLPPKLNTIEHEREDISVYVPLIKE